MKIDNGVKFIGNIAIKKEKIELELIKSFRLRKSFLIFLNKYFVFLYLI